MQGDLFPWESRDDEIFGIMIFYGSTLARIRIKQKKPPKTQFTVWNVSWQQWTSNTVRTILICTMNMKRRKICDMKYVYK